MNLQQETPVNIKYRGYTGGVTVCNVRAGKGGRDASTCEFTVRGPTCTLPLGTGRAHLNLEGVASVIGLEESC